MAVAAIQARRDHRRLGVDGDAELDVVDSFFAAQRRSAAPTNLAPPTLLGAGGVAFPAAGESAAEWPQGSSPCCLLRGAD
jgi:hypothetical protein